MGAGGGAVAAAWKRIDEEARGVAESGIGLLSCEGLLVTPDYFANRIPPSIPVFHIDFSAPPTLVFLLTSHHHEPDFLFNLSLQYLNRSLSTKQ